MSRSRSALAALTGGAVILTLAGGLPPAQAESGERPVLPLSGAASDLDLPLDGVTIASPPGPAGEGPVQVMLELDPAPASTVYARTQRDGERAATKAARAQVARIESLQDQIRPQLREPATRATVLYEAARVYSGIAVRTQADRLPALAGIPGVRAIHTLVPKSIGNFDTIPLIQAPAAWSGVPGVTGDGVTIGIIDTGIDYTHATFGGSGDPADYATAKSAKEAAPPGPVVGFPSAKVAGGYDFAGNDYTGYNTPDPDANPLDCNGHGSHVAGTAAGFGVRSDRTTFPGPWTDGAVPFDAMQIGPGVAPEATLYGLKVFGCEGSTNLVIPALEWAADPNGDSDFTDHLDVVNMSLGSDFGSPDDPDSVATNNTVDAGVVIAASIGNSGDMYETGGSPGNARKAIATAASVDNAEVVDGIVLDGSDVPTPDTYPALQSGAYDWAGLIGVTNGDVVRLGDWNAAPSALNNTDGCSPLSGPDAAAVNGKVVALYWDPDDTRRCGSADRSDRVDEAGATGAILVSAETFFTAGITGSATIPVMLVSAPGSSQIIAGLNAGANVTATMTNALHNSLRNDITGDQDPTDEIVNFSSRGNALANGVKPDVSAPGTTIFSTAVGTGYDGITESGTSMAAPHVAGLAALVAAKHPAWSPEEIKAAVMNTANHDLIVGPAGALPRYDSLRAGSGRIDALQATRTEAVAYVVDDPGAVSVSFGVLDVTSPTTMKKTVRIADKRATGSRRTYAVGIEMLNSLSGATYSVSASSVRLNPGETADVTATLTLDPTQLVHVPDPTINPDQGAIGVMREYLTSVTGRLIVTPPTGYPLRLPLFAAPRPASSLSGGTSAIVDGTGSIRTGTMTMTGTGVDNTGADVWENEISSVSGMELLATSPQIPACSPSVVSDCIPYEDIGSADARYLGATSDAPLITSAGGNPLNTGLAWFGIAAWQPWRTAASVSEYYLYLDLTGDGTEDAIIFNSRYANTDVLVSYTLDAASCGPDGCVVVDMQLLNNSSGAQDTQLMYGNVLTMPVALDALARLGYSADNPRVGMWLETYAATGLVDAIGSASEPVHANLLQPGVTVFGSAETLPQAVTTGDTLRVTLNTATAQASPKALLLHHLNAQTAKAQVVPVEDAASGFAVSPNPLALGPVTVPNSATGTVTVTSSGTKALTFGTGAVSITGPDAARFSITSDSCSGRALAPSATCAVGVQFTPTGSGAASASLVFVDDAATSPQTVALTGNATLAAPTVTAISPASGPAGGGTPVTVTGTGFTDGATVTIGGTAATSVVRTSATTITTVTPAGAVGAADVVVTNPDGQQGTLAGGFTFQGATEPIAQRPTKPLNLPKRLARQGWTTLFTVARRAWW